MSDNEPPIVVENVAHLSAGGVDVISNPATVASKLDALTQSVERLFHTMSAEADFDESVLLEGGEIFDPSLLITGDHGQFDTATEKGTDLELPHGDLFDSPEVCGDDISAGLATCIDASCTKKPAKERLLKIQEPYIYALKTALFCLLRK